MANKHTLTDFDLAMLVNMSENNFKKLRTEYEEIRSWFPDVSDHEIEQMVSIAEEPPEDFQEFRKIGRDNAVLMFLAMLRVSIVVSEDAIENMRRGHSIGRSLYDLLFLGRSSESLKYILRMKSGKDVGQDAANKAVEEILRERGRRGGEAKADRYAPLKQAAVRLASEGQYRSANHAAKRICAAILAMPEAANTGLSKDRAEKTIAQWLRKSDLKFGEPSACQQSAVEKDA
ncbi:hypothetical protein Q3A80_23400 [Burkholderia sp. SR8]|uniref:hypothetical protein n=1 Tax=Burkholderia sp. SR8 TaxID=3062277 RepID=UPI0040636BC4